MMVTALGGGLFIAVLYIVPNFGQIFKKEEVKETEIAEYEVLIHKTDAGRIDVKKSLLKSDGDSETKLSAPPGTLVSPERNTKSGQGCDQP